MSSSEVHLDPIQRIYTPDVCWTADSISGETRLQLRKTITDMSGNPAIHYQIPLKAADVYQILDALRRVFPDQYKDATSYYHQK